MGKGDKRTKRGKINIGSFGNVRKKLKSSVPAKTATAKKTETKKPAKAPTKRVVKK